MCTFVIYTSAVRGFTTRVSVITCRCVCVFVRLDPPHFTCRPRPIYQRQPIQSVTMPCCAEGDPMPLITWRKVTAAPATALTL